MECENGAGKRRERYFLPKLLRPTGLLKLRNYVPHTFALCSCFTTNGVTHRTQIIHSQLVVVGFVSANRFLICMIYSSSCCRVDPYNLHDLEHVSGVDFLQCTDRCFTASHSGRL